MTPSSIEDMWADAVRKYEKLTEQKFSELPRPHTADDLIKEVQDANRQYEKFRDKSSTLFKILSALAKPIELVSNLAAGAGSAVYPPSSMIFGATAYLIKAARGVSAILDAISYLMTELQNFSTRLKVYDQADLSDELREKLTEILITMVEILASSTKKVNDQAFRAKAYFKNVLLGNDDEMQDLWKKLDILTRSENFLVGAETYVEVKSTGKGVQVLQESMTALQLSANVNSQGIAAIKAALNGPGIRSSEENRHNQLENLRKLLSPSTTAQDKFEQIKRERRLVPQSGDWITTEDIFRGWVACDGRPLLWIAGNPGSGKSFLMYNILTCLHDEAGDRSGSAANGSIVGFFFFQDNNTAAQSIRQALCDAAYQLAMHDSAYFNYLNTTSPNVVDFRSLHLTWKVLFGDYWLTDRPDNYAYVVLDGLDEALAQEREILFELLRDVEELGLKSKLRVAMLGRPQVIDEMNLRGLDEIPTIYVDISKNGNDIALYVQSSIAKSQFLRKISTEVKATIIGTLTNKAGGMFMWAKLMIEELNRKAQRGRESDVEKALNEAPKGLTQMIQRVLEGFSASLSSDEAEDLNTMLAWVALSRRPIRLGELDACLRLKSEKGSGLVFLEGLLRKTYASFFTLSREDGLTTSELLAPDSSLDHIADDNPDYQMFKEDGEDDLGHPTEFNSNPKTTTVSFSHASILDFFMNPNHGKVIASSDGSSAIGVDLEADQLAISKACIDVISDKACRTWMKGAVSLLNYAVHNWYDHLEHTKRDLLDEETRRIMRKKLIYMLHDEDSLQEWINKRASSFFTLSTAKRLIPWLKDPVDSVDLDDNIAEWLKSFDTDNELEVFQSAMLCFAKNWLASKNSAWSTVFCAKVTHYWLARRKGGVVQIKPLTADEIVTAAHYGGFEENALFHRKLALCLRECGHYEEAKQSFEKALELDSDMWLATFGIVKIYFQQEQYHQALDVAEIAIRAIDARAKETSNDVSKQLQVNASRTYKLMAQCYDDLRAEIDEYPSATALELEVRACQYYSKAFESNKTDYYSARSCVIYWQRLADGSHPFLILPKYTNHSDLPCRDQCFKEIMSIAHEMDKANNGRPRHWLWTISDPDRDERFLQAIARAAFATGELAWLQECLVQAVTRARKVLNAIIGDEMVLLQASIYDMFMGESEMAISLYESLVSDRALEFMEQTELIRRKRIALAKLTHLCVRKAIEDKSQRERYIGILERISKRSRRRAVIIWEGIKVPSVIDTFLAMFWYGNGGRHSEAPEALRLFAKLALSQLSDGNPSIENNGYELLLIVLLAARDNFNTIALLQRIRHFRAGVAILTSDLKGEEVNNEIDNSDDDEDLNAMMDKILDSNCPCERKFANFDNTFMCRCDFYVFCADCYAKLQRGVSVPGKYCSASHEFLEITPLTTRFSRGEIVVDGVAIKLDAWKETLKQKWNL